MFVYIYVVVNLRVFYRRFVTDIRVSDTVSVRLKATRPCCLLRKDGYIVELCWTKEAWCDDGLNQVELPRPAATQDQGTNATESCRHPALATNARSGLRRHKDSAIV